ncbi:hypothetical protein OAB57_04070, partial [Bacteriovoracaceae bacterium]|nr:hypothetical protein [Bacteriovoracaceae bacterium]
MRSKLNILRVLTISFFLVLQQSFYSNAFFKGSFISVGVASEIYSSECSDNNKDDFKSVLMTSCCQESSKDQFDKCVEDIKPLTEEMEEKSGVFEKMTTDDLYMDAIILSLINMLLVVFCPLSITDPSTGVQFLAAMTFIIPHQVITPMMREAMDTMYSNLLKTELAPYEEFNKDISAEYQIMQLLMVYERVMEKMAPLYDWLAALTIASAVIYAGAAILESVLFAMSLGTKAIADAAGSAA